jgi:hypothetical protein
MNILAGVKQYNKLEVKANLSSFRINLENLIKDQYTVERIVAICIGDSMVSVS